jgi:hypothetical protein
MNDLNYFEDYISDYENIFSTLNSLKTDIASDEISKELENVIEILHSKLDNDYEAYNQRLETAYDEDRKFQQREYWNSQF